ncbi:hypothetical protein CTDIVETGP_1817 [Clostridium tyrobutyricum DIVETGP]|uniref:Uncharacterized protein n=1 Tax=Clostridium tyrobutyricum DIVETGP TaxID=1408889 RepID=W6NI68_CLOTY|nr:hypothetical protein CTK_C26690 [Clostridium tyrobutyricum]CDL91747.1 hypothetical protein CTDIVETGP_1817 [Clostridium tyrobutyricum DIVETGP]
MSIKCWNIRKGNCRSFLQCIPYVGFPKILNAVSVAKDISLNKES